MSMIGLLTIPWTMTAELFPTDIRGIAHSLSYSMANILMFAAIQSYRSVIGLVRSIHSTGGLSYKIKPNFLIKNVLSSDIHSMYNNFLSFHRSLTLFLGGAYAVQWFFAAVSICGFGFALIFLPETHGKKLSEIQAHFSGGGANKQKKVKKQKKNGVTNRKPKQTLETVQESERMMKETV